MRQICSKRIIRKSKQKDKKTEGLNLMIPGPVQLDYSVLSQMSTPMVAHYGEGWARFYNEVVRKLKIRPEGGEKLGRPNPT